MTPYQQAINQINQKYAGTTTTSAPPKQPGFFTKNIINPVKDAFNSGVEQTKQGFQDAKTAGFNPVKSFEATLKTGSGIATALTSPLAPILNPTVGAGTQALGNKIAENPTVQKFANSPAGQVTSRVAEDVGNAANIAGTVAGGVQAADAIHPIFNRATPIMNPDLVTATAQRAEAASSGIKALNQMGEQVGQFKTDLGTNFEQGAKGIEQTQPGKTLDLTSKQLESLNNLKESKNFALPDTLDTESNPLMSMGGSADYMAKNASKFADIQNATKASLSPSQAQDLIRRLNKLTFDAKASGDLAVNQQTIGLTNEIKQSASKTFGPEWDKIYSNYSQGRNAVESLNDIVNLDKNATPTDINNSLNKILKLGKTPEGKIILQQALDEFKNTSGIDLTDPVNAVHQVLDKQIALEEAQKVAKAKEAAPKAMLKYIEKRAIGTAVVGGAASIFLYPLFKKIRDALEGK